MTRREIMKTMLLFGVQTIIPLFGESVEASFTKSRRSGKLSLYNVHTGESLSIQYLNKRGGFDKRACQRLNHFFRCHHDGRVHQIDPRLFLLMDAIRCLLGACGRPYHLVSGYRSPSYNRLLCHDCAGVARNSYHIRGMAADVSMDGVALRDIVKVAGRLKAGGVGSYSDFVHLDLGPERAW